MPPPPLSHTAQIPRRRFFPRGYWVAVALVVAIYGLFDGLYVLRQRRNSTDQDLTTLERYLASYIAKDHLTLSRLVSEEAEQTHRLSGRGPTGVFGDSFECDLKRVYLLDTTYLGEDRVVARRIASLRVYSVVLEFVGTDKKSRLARCRVAFEGGIRPTIYSIETEPLVGAARMVYQAKRRVGER